MQQMFYKYSELLNSSMPPIQDASQELNDSAAEISPEADVELACSTHGTGPNQPVQVLLDVFVSGWMICACVCVCVCVCRVVWVWMIVCNAVSRL